MRLAPFRASNENSTQNLGLLYAPTHPESWFYSFAVVYVPSRAFLGSISVSYSVLHWSFSQSATMTSADSPIMNPIFLAIELELSCDLIRASLGKLIFFPTMSPLHLPTWTLGRMNFDTQGYLVQSKRASYEVRVPWGGSLPRASFRFFIGRKDYAVFLKPS